jgi:hypothetical protein
MYCREQQKIWHFACKNAASAHPTGRGRLVAVQSVEKAKSIIE